MSSLDEMSLQEVEAQLAQLKERRRQLKKTGKTTERKIATLARRRERWMDKIRQIDTQIEDLRRETNLVQPVAPRRRGRRPKSMQTTAG